MCAASIIFFLFLSSTYPDRRDGRDQDQATALGQVLVSFLGHKILRLDIDGEDFINIFLAHLLDVTEMLNARVAHDDVDAAQVCDGLAEELGDIFALADVGAHANGADAVLFAGRCGDGFGGAGRVYVVDYHVGAKGGELEGYGGAYAAA